MPLWLLVIPVAMLIGWQVRKYWLAVRITDGIRLVHLTDTHLVASRKGQVNGVTTFDTAFAVRRAAMNEHPLPPHLVLLGGDQSHDGSSHSYQWSLSNAETFGRPIYAVPGNHDTPSVQSQVFTGSGTFTRPEQDFVLGPWQIILLNSTITGSDGGHLSEADLSRLRDRLKARPTHHVLVCLHHNPVPVGSKCMDAIGVDNGADLIAALAEHKPQKVVLFGHVHQEFQAEHSGIKFFASPSTCAQFKPGSMTMPCEIDDTVTPGYRWMTLLPDGQVKTSVHRLPPSHAKST